MVHDGCREAKTANRERGHDWFLRTQPKAEEIEQGGAVLLDSKVEPKVEGGKWAWWYVNVEERRSLYRFVGT